MTAGPQAVEPRPPVAEDVFGDRTGLAERFVTHLSTTAVEWGLLGPRELPRLWTRHVLNCAAVAELVPAGAGLVDVGSGAGLPGIALALARPDLRPVLVEPLERRVAWLERVVDDLGVDVRVRRGRAEDLVGELRAPVVTARAVAPLRQLARWGLPLTAPGGVLLAIKGRTAQAEVDQSSTLLRRLGAVDVAVLQCGTAWLEVPTTVVRVRVGSGPARPAPAPRTDRHTRRGRR